MAKHENMKDWKQTVIFLWPSLYVNRLCMHWRLHVIVLPLRNRLVEIVSVNYLKNRLRVQGDIYCQQLT